MGASDRDYFREEERRYTASRRPPLPPVTKALLIANLVIFFLDLLTRKQGAELGVIGEELCYSTRSAILQGHVWELLTYQFLHASLVHVALNVLSLWVFGGAVEKWWGSSRFLVFYLLCGVAGALFFSLLNAVGLLPGRDLESPLVGASAGLYGVLMCIAVINPKQPIHPSLSINLRQLALFVLGVAVFVIIADNLLGWEAFHNSGGEAGHLGGAILGFLFTRFPRLLRKGAESKIIRPKEFRRPRPKAKLRPRTSVDVATASEVDRILDKISREGVQSLTDREREILNQAGNSFKDR